MCQPWLQLNNQGPVCVPTRSREPVRVPSHCVGRECGEAWYTVSGQHWKDQHITFDTHSGPSTPTIDRSTKWRVWLGEALHQWNHRDNLGTLCMNVLARPAVACPAFPFSTLDNGTLQGVVAINHTSSDRSFMAGDTVSVACDTQRGYQAKPGHGGQEDLLCRFRADYRTVKWDDIHIRCAESTIEPSCSRDEQCRWPTPFCHPDKGTCVECVSSSSSG
ncbi:unnamed protein product [Vitrella brassicaformis CCMP3155]|uniref:Uncharacterized protein n=1 Tax=Vitrella brassicaformis (strain CCMP3155) TaxID=1169540 RepID=A0A0G4FU51_VITBC|nr:unnamed protein product [Vitrella brassicaformis CCMP3155]|eukprot:CEM18436.1 unnamed protein product [Vitrella brassicaformis CCMP3155]